MGLIYLLLKVILFCDIISGMDFKKETALSKMLKAARSVRSTGLEPVPVAGHAPQTCAYADSATTAYNDTDYNLSDLYCQVYRE